MKKSKKRSKWIWFRENWMKSYLFLCSMFFLTGVFGPSQYSDYFFYGGIFAAGGLGIFLVIISSWLE
jgi:hypothetical protein